LFPAGQALRAGFLWLQHVGVMSYVPCQRLIEGEIIAQNEHAAVFPAAFPVSPGHVPVVSRRHVAGCFSLTPEEQRSTLDPIPGAREWVEAEQSPGASNRGVNIGSVAGQGVPHVHVHLTPLSAAMCAIRVAAFAGRFQNAPRTAAAETGSACVRLPSVPILQSLYARESGGRG